MPEVNGVYRLSVAGVCNGQQHIITHHFLSTAAAVAVTEPDYQQALIDSWQASCRTSYRARFADDDEPCLTYSVRKVCGSLPLPAGVDEGEAAGSRAGTLGRVAANLGHRLPAWLSSVVTLRTAYAGRSYRGRIFLGGLNEGQTNGDDMEAAYLAHTTAYMTALMGAFGPTGSDDDYRLFVFSRLLAAAVGASCEDCGAPVTSYQVRAALASMKSRKAGSGV